jgi:hypothetical protein
MLIALLAIVLISCTTAVWFQPGNASADGGLTYIGENGDTVALADTNSPEYLDAGFFNSPSGSYTLDGGPDGRWYVITESASIAELNLSGEVHLIIKNGITLTVTGGTYAAGNAINIGGTDHKFFTDVAAGSDVHIYREAGDDGNAGVFAGGYGGYFVSLLGLREGSTLTNTACIHARSHYGIDVFDGGTIENYGTIEIDTSAEYGRTV